MPRRWHIGTIFEAMSSAIASPSMTHGPANKKKLPLGDVFKYSDNVILFVSLVVLCRCQSLCNYMECVTGDQRGCLSPQSVVA